MLTDWLLFCAFKKVSSEDFLKTFGAPIEKSAELIESKTLTLSKLLTIAPPGTIDPTPHL